MIWMCLIYWTKEATKTFSSPIQVKTLSQRTPSNSINCKTSTRGKCIFLSSLFFRANNCHCTYWWFTCHRLKNKLKYSRNLGRIRTFDRPEKLIGNTSDVASWPWSGVRITVASAWSEIAFSLLLATCSSGPTVSSITWKTIPRTIFNFISSTNRQNNTFSATCKRWHERQTVPAKELHTVSGVLKEHSIQNLQLEWISRCISDKELEIMLFLLILSNFCKRKEASGWNLSLILLA